MKIFILAIFMTIPIFAKAPDPEPFSKTLQRQQNSQGDKRDAILLKHIGKELYSMDETARYIFHKVLNEYSISDTIKKYPYLNKDKVLALRRDLIPEKND